MARLSRFWTVAVLLGGATVSLSACTGDPAPTASVTPTPVVVSESPPPSPSPTALSNDELLALIPEEAQREDFFGADAFAKFFVLEYQRMFDQHDSSLFALVSEPECLFCAGALQSYVELVGKGGTREGGVITIPDEFAKGGLRDDGYWYVGFTLSETDTNDYDATGTLIKTEPGVDGDTVVKLVWRDGYWHVMGVNVPGDSGG